MRQYVSAVESTQLSLLEAVSKNGLALLTLQGADDFGGNMLPVLPP